MSLKHYFSVFLEVDGIYRPTNTGYFARWRRRGQSDFQRERKISKKQAERLREAVAASA